MLARSEFSNLPRKWKREENAYAGKKLNTLSTSIGGFTASATPVPAPPRDTYRDRFLSVLGLKVGGNPSQDIRNDYAQPAVYVGTYLTPTVCRRRMSFNLIY